MISKKRILLTLFLSLVLYYLFFRGVIVIYVANASASVDLAQIKVLIDDEVVVDEYLKSTYDLVSYNVFHLLNHPQGKSHLVVEAPNFSLVREKSFDLNHFKCIIIELQYDTSLVEFTLNSVRQNLPPDSVVTAKDIGDVGQVPKFMIFIDDKIPAFE